MFSTKYNHLEVEKNKNQYWQKKKLFFLNKKSTKQPFVIIMPPPNVTGTLHLGHAWDNTLQDILIRYKKMCGFNTLWIPGMDHAGISMQRKVEQKLRDNGIDPILLSEKEFFQVAFEWKKQHEKIIRKQWAKLGLAIDYSKEKFTMDQDVSEAVKIAFVKMYEQNLIYQGYKVVNWDPIQKTAISNIEVIHKEIEGNLYYFKYHFVNEKNFLVVATTRPETMFGDVCLVVNPSDDRYKSYIGKKVINPANKKTLLVISDEHVDSQFGTGVMKCTPAHDFNDYELALKHNLEMPICINTDGTMNNLAQEFKNLDRFDCQKKIVLKIKQENNLVKIENHLHVVGHSERSGAIIEPLLSKQWFVKMQPIVKKAISSQKNTNKKVSFYPNRFEQTYLQWMNKAHDWCISRQIKWGHKIPVWKHNKTNKLHVDIIPPKNQDDYTQESMVLDTWFSSALWPFSVMGWPQNNFLINNFFPTSVLVTGYDIIFFWISRMIFQSQLFLQKNPFKKLLVHGLIRASDGKKMSKSLGNGVDPNEVIRKYGADALRYFLATNSTPGLDLKYDETKVKSSWNFINKIWNIARYIKINVNQDTLPILEKNLSFLNQWIIAKFNHRLKKIILAMDKFEFGAANKEIFNFIYDDFASVYIELSKVEIQKKPNQTKQVLLWVLRQTLKILHPYIPFVTEHIFQIFYPNKSIVEMHYPQWRKTIISNDFNFLNEAILTIRQIRAENNIKPSQQILVNIIFKKSLNIKIEDYLLKLVNTQLIYQEIKNASQFPFNSGVVKIQLQDYIDQIKIMDQLLSKLNKIKLRINNLTKKLNNPNIKKAPQKIVLNFEKSLDDALTKKQIIKKEISKLKTKH